MKKKVQTRSILAFAGGITAGFGFLAALSAVGNPDNTMLSTAGWVVACAITAGISLAAIAGENNKTCNKPS